MGFFHDLAVKVGISHDPVVEAPPPPPPPPPPAEPEPSAAPNAQTTPRAGSGPMQVAGLQGNLQAQLSATATNPTGVKAADRSEYLPGQPRVEDSKPLPGDADGILTGFSQWNGPGPGGEQCGAATVVAGAVSAKGKQGAAELADELAKDKSLGPAEKKRYTELAKTLRSPNATYGDLGKLTAAIHQDFAEQIGDSKEKTMDGEMMASLMKRPPNSGKNVPMKLNIRDQSGQPGDHWVLIRDGKQGRSAWDPMPKEGSQLVDAEKYRQKAIQQSGYVTPDKVSTFGVPNM